VLSSRFESALPWAGFHMPRFRLAQGRLFGAAIAGDPNFLVIDHYH
jgi:hypothetical protein